MTLLGDTARERLWWALWDGYADREKEAFIDAFAHELAEQIRKHPDHDNPWGSGFYSVLGLGMAADMIDPEVKP